MWRCNWLNWSSNARPLPYNHTFFYDRLAVPTIFNECNRCYSGNHIDPHHGQRMKMPIFRAFKFNNTDATYPVKWVLMVMIRLHFQNVSNHWFQSIVNLWSSLWISAHESHRKYWIKTVNNRFYWIAIESYKRMHTNTYITHLLYFIGRL